MLSRRDFNDRLKIQLDNARDFETNINFFINYVEPKRMVKRGSIISIVHKPIYSTEVPIRSQCSCIFILISTIVKWPLLHATRTQQRYNQQRYFPLGQVDLFAVNDLMMPFLRDVLRSLGRLCSIFHLIRDQEHYESF